MEYPYEIHYHFLKQTLFTYSVIILLDQDLFGTCEMMVLFSRVFQGYLLFDLDGVMRPSFSLLEVLDMTRDMIHSLVRCVF